MLDRFSNSSGQLFKIQHPYPAFQNQPLFLLYDPVHLIKNFRNNWITEKTQTLRFIDPETDRHIFAKWSNIRNFFDSERCNTLRRTPLTYSAVHPSTIEHQKVSLVVQILHDRTIAAMRQDGHDSTARTLSFLL